MPTFTIVNDADGTFRVHRTGCGDITRRTRNGSWQREAANADEVVRLEREDLRAGGFGAEADDFEFVVLPCVAGVQ